MSCEDDTTEVVTPSTTLCDRDRTNNVWVEGADEYGVGGVCLLDTMSDPQLVYILQRNEIARADLCRVTSDPHLLELAATVPRLPSGVFGDEVQKEVNRNDDSLPFYSVFRGRPPTAR